MSLQNICQFSFCGSAVQIFVHVLRYTKAPGAVTPLGLLNDSELRVIFYLDKDFFKEPFLIGVHPNDNTATVWLNVNDLADIIKKHGNDVIVTEISNA